MRHSRLIAFLTLVVALMAGITSVSATFAVEVESDFDCDRVRVEYELAGALPNLSFRIQDADGNILSDEVEAPSQIGEHRINIRLYQEQPEGTQLFVRYAVGIGYFNAMGDYVGNCTLDDNDSEPGEPLPEPPYRLGGENARLKVYVVEDNGPQNPVLAFYRVNEDATGNLIFYVSAAQLAADYPDVPETPVLIFSQGPYSFYKLPSGEFQVNAGPDAEGKVDVLIFTGVPPQNVHRDQFNVNTLLGWLPPALRDTVAS